MTADSIPVLPLSVWNPIHLGTDETGQQASASLAERNMLIGGEPGGGKSVALQLIVAHGALSADCKLIPIDGKRVELGLWADCAERFVGPSIDDAIDVMHWLQGLIDERTDVLLQMKKRKVTPDMGWPFYLVPIDEVAYFSATVGTEIDPRARGVSWLRAEDGIPRRIKAAYLTDDEIIHLAAWAAQARATHHASSPATDANVIRLGRGEAA